MEATTEPMVFGLEADSGAIEAGEGGGGLRIGGVGGAAGFFVVAVAAAGFFSGALAATAGFFTGALAAATGFFNGALTGTTGFFNGGFVAVAAGFFSGALAGSDFAFVNGGFGVGFTAALAGAGLSGAFGAALTGGRGDGLGDGFGDGLTGGFAGRDFDFVKVGFGGGGFGFVNCSGFTGALTAAGLAAGFTAAGLVVGGDFVNRAGAEVGGLALRAGLAAVVVRALSGIADVKRRAGRQPVTRASKHLLTHNHNFNNSQTQRRAKSTRQTASTTLALSPLLDWVHLLP